MPYPPKVLHEGEELALDLRPHWWFFAKHIVSGIVLFLLVILILAKLHDDARTWSLVPWGILALAWAAWLGLKYLNWNFTHFVVTSDRVISRTGVLAKRG